MGLKKDLLFTFDYELFLGARSGTVENCLLTPTSKILDIFARHSLSKAIFFVDTTYLVNLKENPDPRCQADFQKIRHQLQEVAQKGHYIYPHLHPHWRDAKYLPDINQWDLSDTTHYSVKSLSENDRARLFAESTALLTEIRGPEPELGYRAGGWCIQPFSDFKNHFEKHNILYDFSVMPGYSCDTEFQYFDFRSTPKERIYSFSEETHIEDKNGRFKEYCISIVRMRYFNRAVSKFFSKILHRKGVTNYGDGISTHSAAQKEISPYGHEMASIELLSVINLDDYLSAIDKKEYTQFISHPKMLTPHNLLCLDLMLKKLTTKYEVNTDFKKIHIPTASA